MAKNLNRIKAVLADKQHTNKWLAEQLGKDPATVNKWCTNSSQPPLKTLMQIARVLGYARWKNFIGAIGRTMESCKTLGINVDDHFREVTKMIALAKGAQREVQDFMLTRYACYLIAQNGDPKKEEQQRVFVESYYN